MSNKYLDTKIDSLEESIMDVWQTAAEEETTAEGAVKGAATGAAIGSIVPGVGTAIGGAVGALAGARRRRKGKDKYSRKALEKQILEKIENFDIFLLHCGKPIFDFGFYFLLFFRL